MERARVDEARKVGVQMARHLLEARGSLRRVRLVERREARHVGEQYHGLGREAHGPRLAGAHLAALNVLLHHERHERLHGLDGARVGRPFVGGKR